MCAASCTLARLARLPPSLADFRSFPIFLCPWTASSEGVPGIDVGIGGISSADDDDDDVCLLNAAKSVLVRFRLLFMLAPDEVFMLAPEEVFGGWGYRSGLSRGVGRSTSDICEVLVMSFGSLISNLFTARFFAGTSVELALWICCSTIDGDLADAGVVAPLPADMGGPRLEVVIVGNGVISAVVFCFKPPSKLLPRVRLNADGR